MKLGDKIRLARNQRGMTLEACGRKMGIRRQAWHRWETGQVSPHYGSLEQIAAVFDMTVIELLSVTADPASAPEEVVA